MVSSVDLRKTWLKLTTKDDHQEWVILSLSSGTIFTGLNNVLYCTNNHQLRDLVEWSIAKTELEFVR